MDYARLLRSLGLREGAALWASRAGTAGEQLMEELFQGEGGMAEALLSKEEAELGQESAEWLWRHRTQSMVQIEDHPVGCEVSVKVTHCELNQCQRPEESWSLSPHREKRGDTRSFLHVKLSVRHWSLLVSVTVVKFLSAFYDQCVFLCICVCMYQPQKDTLLSLFLH